MKQITATLRVLSAYENKHKKPLFCSRCGRKINMNERLQRTTHFIHYYCSECAKKIEI